MRNNSSVQVRLLSSVQKVPVVELEVTIGLSPIALAGVRVRVSPGIQKYADVAELE